MQSFITKCSLIIQAGLAIGVTTHLEKIDDY